MATFEFREGLGSRGGMTIQVSEGPKSTMGETRSIYFDDASYSFIEAILLRIGAGYTGDARWGITELGADVWRAVVEGLRELSLRLADGIPPSVTDVNWLTEIDLDNDTEIDASTFIRSLASSPADLENLRKLIANTADWIEDSSHRNGALTIFGY